MKLDGGLSWRWSGPQRIINGRLDRRAPQLSKVRARRGRQERRSVDLGRIAEHQSCAAQSVFATMWVGLVFCGGVMGVPRHLMMIRDVSRVRSAMRVFMARQLNRLGACLQGPARDENHRGQDMGQGGGEALNHSPNIARSMDQENHLRPDVTRRADTLWRNASVCAMRSHDRDSGPS